ncbi:MAG: hypothetical protein AB1553_07230 [Nitrospirota bacterium]
MTLLHLLNDRLSWHSRAEWDIALALLAHFFERYDADLAKVKEHARSIREGIDAVNSFLQLNTAEVCPHCTKVCCANRHGYYDHEDLIYIHALGLRPPRYREGIDDSASCQFIAPNGCTIERSLRPFRCNWYFCDPLLQHMSNGPARPYRAFIAQFQRIIEARRQMVDEFFKTVYAKNDGL